MKIDRRTFIQSAGSGALGFAGALLTARRGLGQLAHLFHHPYVQQLQAERGHVLWTTLEPGVGAVQISTDRTFDTSVQATVREFPSSDTGIARFYLHQAELTGLRPGTRYHYRVLSGDAPLLATDDLTFRTPGTGSFRFLVVGDSGYGGTAQGRVYNLMQRELPDFIVHTGDIAYGNGTYEEFKRLYFDFYRQVLTRVPVFPCPGNHDMASRGGAAYLNLMSVPTASVPAAGRGRFYSFDWGNAHFVSLDSTISLDESVQGNGEMLNWLDDDLRKTRKFWRFAVFHHPPFGSGPNEGEKGCLQAREFIVRILERHGVQIVWNGHEHSYQRTKPIFAGRPGDPVRGITYVTSGGGGAELYSTSARDFTEKVESVHHYLRVAIDGGRLAVLAVRVDGTELESFALAPVPVITSLRTAAVAPPGVMARRGLITIVGRQLAFEEHLETGAFPPTEVGGTVVHLDGRRLPLIYVSGTEILAQLRATSRGAAVVRVTTPNGWTEATTYL